MLCYCEVLSSYLHLVEYVQWQTKVVESLTLLLLVAQNIAKSLVPTSGTSTRLRYPLALPTMSSAPSLAPQHQPLSSHCNTSLNCATLHSTASASPSGAINQPSSTPSSATVPLCRAELQAFFLGYDQTSRQELLMDCCHPSSHDHGA